MNEVPKNGILGNYDLPQSEVADNATLQELHDCFRVADHSPGARSIGVLSTILSVSLPELECTICPFQNTL